MERLSILKQNQAYGLNQLDIIEKIGLMASISDFAIVAGGYVSNEFYSSNRKSFSDRCGKYWMIPDDAVFKKCPIVNDDGIISSVGVDNRQIGARLVLSFKSSKFLEKLVSRRNNDGVLEVEYGYYPQDSVNAYLEDLLENNFLLNNLETTCNTYTMDSRKYYETDKDFRPKILKEYKFDNRYFVRIQIDSCYCGEYFYLSNYKNYGYGDYVWIEVKPVKWFVDEVNKVLISEKLLFSGVQYSENIGSKDTLNNMDIFIKTIFAMDLFQRKNSSLESNISSSRCDILKEQLQTMRKELEYYKKENMELELDKQILTKENELYEMAYDKLKTIRKK